MTHSDIIIVQESLLGEKPAVCLVCCFLELLRLQRVVKSRPLLFPRARQLPSQLVESG